MLNCHEVKCVKISKKMLLYMGLVFNIGLLAYFKYMDFFIENINTLSGSNITLLHLALPLGISFFTLQQIALLIDSYEGLAKERDFLNYAIFVTFFPQLISGPIVHHAEMMPQFSNTKNKLLNYQNIAMGLFIFSIGLFKKVVIADTFAIWATAGFDTGSALNFFEAWATSLSYTFQIYFDFSGYMDMAIGAALLFNIKLPINFNSPYRATGMIEYWSRWHITLTNFITTYVYTPILRSFQRVTFPKAMLATFLAMFISGLWHGASWMFIFWGIIHGIGLITNHYWRKTKIKLHTLLAWFITFNFVNITMVFFRAKEWDDAMKVLGSMFSLNNIVLPGALSTKLSFLTQYGISFGEYMNNINGDMSTIVWLFVGFALSVFFKNIHQIMGYPQMNNPKAISIKNALLFGLLFGSGLVAISTSDYTEFIYFNF